MDTAVFWDDELGLLMNPNGSSTLACRFTTNSLCWDCIWGGAR